MGHIEDAHAQQEPATQIPPVVAEFLSDAEEWAAGRMWIPRALLLLYLVYADFRFLRDPLSGTIFSGITLAFHEMGHVIFAFAGHFICSLMGSGTQVLIPIIAIIVFLRQPDYFGVSVGGFWLSFSLFELANYVADARTQELPLVSLGSGDPEHDWHYLLNTMGMLRMDTTFAFLIRCGATVIGIASFAFAIWMLIVMARTKRALFRE
ncbi:MAG TPA: hypothetical protein VLU46_00945 [Thermoanaerobaculia bacterium]|nr:hypothetical protein [Thermoanaerobaculia bacterium]